jgi:hypothetical protein
MIAKRILSEQGEYVMYRVIARFTHTEDITVQELGNLLRAVEGVVTIVQVDHDFYKKNAVMKVKLITNKGSQVALKEFKMRAIRNIKYLKKVEFAMNTLTQEG